MQLILKVNEMQKYFSSKKHNGALKSINKREIKQINNHFYFNYLFFGTSGLSFVLQ